MARPLYFDNAATTPCCEKAIRRMEAFAGQDFGHASSSHAYGQKAAAAIREARHFFADVFAVTPDQIVFTGSGTEADNLAIYGVALQLLSKRETGKVLFSALEHSAVKKTALSLADFGFDPQAIPVSASAQIDHERLKQLLAPETRIVSIHQVNNIVGAVFPVEELAAFCKQAAPQVLFHTDAIQAFGRIASPRQGSPVDMISISSHKIEGPKGVGALVLLNPRLVKTAHTHASALRPLIWGGGQEGGLRSGTPNAGLIAGFHAAAEITLAKRTRYSEHTSRLRDELKARLTALSLFDPAHPKTSRIVWNSPQDAVPHIVNLSFPGLQAGPLARLLEDQGCLLSTGSACSSGKVEPEPVLAAMGLPLAIQTSAIRISFSDKNSIEDVGTLVEAIQNSIRRADLLSGRRSPR